MLLPADVTQYPAKVGYPVQTLLVPRCVPTGARIRATWPSTSRPSTLSTWATSAPTAASCTRTSPASDSINAFQIMARIKIPKVRGKLQFPIYR